MKKLKIFWYNKFMILLKEMYGINIWEQEKGTELGEKVLNDYNKNNSSVIIDFQGVLNVNTAFFNAFLSAISLEIQDIEKFKDVFKFKNINENIKSVFSISYSFLKYKVFENEQ